MITYHIGGRRTGKTSELLKWMNEAPEDKTRMMVCVNMAMARSTWQLSKRLGYKFDHSQFISYESCLRGFNRGMVNVELCVDNLDYMLRRIFGYSVEKVTTDGQAFLHTFDHAYEYRESQEVAT